MKNMFLNGNLFGLPDEWFTASAQAARQEAHEQKMAAIMADHEARMAQIQQVTDLVAAGDIKAAIAKMDEINKEENI